MLEESLMLKSSEEALEESELEDEDEQSEDDTAEHFGAALFLLRIEVYSCR
jgi:hypothetical protein